MRGQAMITLLVFMIIGMTVISVTSEMIMVNSLGGTKQQMGENAYSVAESGIEDALLRFLRYPGYTGDSFPVGAGIVEVSRTGTGPYVFLSKGTVGNHVRKIQVTVTYEDNLVTILDKREVF